MAKHKSQLKRVKSNKNSKTKKKKFPAKIKTKGNRY